MNETFSAADIDKDAKIDQADHTPNTYIANLQIADERFFSGFAHFAASGALGPGGALPTNTGGGMLSAYYMWGMTPVSEAVIQARGDGGERQVDRADLVAVSGNGGIFNYHATLVLSPAAS